MGPKLTFGEWIEDRYQRVGLTQFEFAEAINVAQSTVSGWVSGGKRPRRRLIPGIARVLNVSEDELLERAGYARRDPGWFESERGDRLSEPPVEIDLSDPLISFAAQNQHRLTDAQKRAMVAMAKEFLKSQEQDVAEEEP